MVRIYVIDGCKSEHNPDCGLSYHRSDSECESVSQTPTREIKKKVTASKRKPFSSASTGSTSRSQKKKPKSVDVFGLCEDDISTIELNTKDSKTLPSYIVIRVANGNQRRLATTNGAFYIDIKVYTRDDAENNAKDTRWTKALLRLNCYLEEESTQWKHLQRFV